MWSGARGHRSNEPFSFFYITIKNGIVEDIQRMFNGLERDIDILLQNVIELCYFMRGAISYEEMMMRTAGERQRIGDFIRNRLEAESKKMNPNY